MVQTRGALEHVSGEMQSLTHFADRYGERGLNKRLTAKLGQLGLREDKSTLIERARLLSEEVHQESKPRTYEPFFNHILRATLRLLEQLEVYDPEVIAALLLHDTVEMHPHKVIEIASPETARPIGEEAARAIALSALSGYITPQTAGYVGEITAPLLEPGEDRIKAYASYTRSIFIHGQPGSWAAKTADFIDNATPPPHGEDPQKRHALDIKQLAVYPYHLEAVTHPDSLIPHERQESVRRLLLDAQNAAIAREEIRHNRL